MQTIDLECPSCGEMLELDSGFAGGVCRCSSCGTLMTVPSDAGVAETLSRPGDNQSFDSDVDLGAMSGSVMSRTPSSRGKKKGKGRAGSKRRGSERIEAGEYRTASGKVVKLDSTVRVPMAESKKKQVRALTAVVFFGVVLLGVIAGVVAIMMITSSGDPGDGSGEVGPPVYDATANPYNLPYANVAGLPLQGTVAVVVEASETSSDWMFEVGDLVAAGLAKPGVGVSVGLYAAEAEDGSKADIPAAGLSGLKRDEVKAWFEDMPGDAVPDVEGAISTALDTAPDMLILILSEADADDIAAWSSLLDAQAGLTIHVVLINGIPSDLREWLSGREGSELVLLSPQDIDNFEFMSDDRDRDE